MHTLETPRLRLRQWQEADIPHFARMGADAETMRYFPQRLTAEQSRAMALRCQALIAQRGWGFWAAEHKATQQFMGFVGLHVPAAQLPCSPCVEVWWRLQRAF